MGMIYQHVVDYVDGISGDIILEIGSDRYEGSTIFLADLAQKKNISLYTVDIDISAYRRIKHPSIVWQYSIGSDWCQNILPDLQKKIGLLYLDNFDYNWDVNKYNENIARQQQDYLSRFGLEMNNQACQLEHMRQMMHCLPHMSEHSVVMCDDTYLFNDCWIGKCGGVVIWLLSLGWNLAIVRDCGVILTSPKYKVTIDT